MLNTGSNSAAIMLNKSFKACIENCIIENNSALEKGAALYLINIEQILVNRSYINNNVARSSNNAQGGGLYIQNCEILTITGNSFFENNSAHSGGGIYCFDNMVVDISNNTFHSNIGSGAAIFFRENISGQIANNLFEENKGKTTIYFSSLSEVSILNNKFIKNICGDSTIKMSGNSGNKALIYNNVFVENIMDHEQAILQTCDITSLQNIGLYNNTFLNNKSENRIYSAVYLAWYNSESIVKNNIFSGYDTAIWVYGEKNHVIMNNDSHNVDNILYWNNQFMGNDSYFISMLLSNFKDNYTWSPGFITGTNEFHLSDTSQNIDAGIDTKIYHDIDGDLSNGVF